MGAGLLDSGKDAGEFHHICHSTNVSESVKDHSYVEEGMNIKASSSTILQLIEQGRNGQTKEEGEVSIYYMSCSIYRIANL